MNKFLIDIRRWNDELVSSLARCIISYSYHTGIADFLRTISHEFVISTSRFLDSYVSESCDIRTKNAIKTYNELVRNLVSKTDRILDSINPDEVIREMLTVIYQQLVWIAKEFSYFIPSIQQADRSTAAAA